MADDPVQPSYVLIGTITWAGEATTRKQPRKIGFRPPAKRKKKRK